MTNTQNLLHYQFTPPEQSTTRPTLVFIHGLFGDMNNLGVIARRFSEHYPILRMDLRNHGQSFHSNEMNYELMAQDLLHLFDHLQLKKVILIGHSMGGKTAMKVAALKPDLVEKLIVIDIAPVNYANDGHADVFAGLFAVKKAGITTRQQAKTLLSHYIQEEAVQQFMLKSFVPDSLQRFRFNLSALYQNYTHLIDWQECLFPKPTLFIKGQLSHYILSEFGPIILRQFPQATSFIVNGCGHWVHAEKPDFVIRAIERFLV
ncbi:MAG TPA: esterase [Pasteurellaceae bacterium]|nr:esterase [Pasteurellaceae bacterium]